MQSSVVRNQKAGLHDGVIISKRSYVMKIVVISHYRNDKIRFLFDKNSVLSDILVMKHDKFGFLFVS